MLAEIFSMAAIVVVIVIVAVLFGGTQIPKLARSLGSARSEFKKGLAEVQEPPVGADASTAAHTGGGTA
jgi:sec-independent protein translocase protein TatA